MKRLKLILLAGIVLLAALVLLSLLPKSGPAAPRYVPVRTQPVGSFSYQAYGWGEVVPFRDGQFWITLVDASSSNRSSHRFLYDLDRRIAIGELLNGGPIFANGDQSRLLCEGETPPSLEDRLKFLLARLTFGKVNLTNNTRVEGFWLLDLRDNSAIFLGRLAQSAGSGSRWVPAPGFRFGYNRPSVSAWGREFYLCDLDQKLLKRIDFTGELLGWWDDHQILATDSATNYIAFDVLTGKTSTLFTREAIAGFLKQQDIPEDPAGLAATSAWNGHDYDWYLSGQRKSGLDTNSTFLVKLDRAGPSFKLLYREFQFHWLGHLDASGTRYLYAGESGKPGSGGNGGAFLRELSNNTARTIVPPYMTGQYSLPRLYSNTVIYSSNRILWRVEINTTNAEPLFPAPAK